MSGASAGPDLARRRAAELTLTELLRRSAARAPDAPALALGPKTRSYGELDERADRLAAALRERGVVAGDRVAVWMRNSIEMVETLFAVQKLGAAAVPLNFRLGSQEARFILEDADAVGVIADQDLLERVAGWLQIGWTLMVAEDDAGSSYEEAIRAETGPPPEVLVEDGAPAFVMYTSGTTGRPKGAVLTHRNLVANTWNWSFEVGVGRDDVYTSGLPLFHIGGLVGLYPFLHLGRPVLLQPSGGFDPQVALDLQERGGATVCAYVPAQWRLIVEQPRARTQLLGARRSIWGASPAGRQLLEAMAETLSADTVVSTFGQTEVTANATFLAPRDSLRKLGSVGRPVATMEHRIVDDDERDVPVGEVGEIVYRGPTVMLGYHDRDDANANAFRGGWFHSGDLVREDEEGYIFAIERKDDMILSGAENIYPAEVEGVLAEHPAVRESAVVGVPDDRWGQTPVAFVVPTGADAASADELVAYVATRLAGYKKPSRVNFVDELPRNASGKVLRRTLRNAEAS